MKIYMQGCFVPEASQLLPTVAFQDTSIWMTALTILLKWALFAQEYVHVQGEMWSAGINTGKLLVQGCTEDSTLLAGKRKGESSYLLYYLVVTFLSFYLFAISEI